VITVRDVDVIDKGELCRLWASRAARSRFSRRHQSFIDAVCAQGMDLDEAAASITIEPDVAADLRLTMVAIAEDERRRRT